MNGKDHVRLNGPVQGLKEGVSSDRSDFWSVPLNLWIVCHRSSSWPLRPALTLPSTPSCRRVVVSFLTFFLSRQNVFKTIQLTIRSSGSCCQTLETRPATGIFPQKMFFLPGIFQNSRPRKNKNDLKLFMF